MAWYDRFWPRRERRDAGFYALSPKLAEIYAGATEEAEHVPAVAACITLISSIIGSLPAQIMRDGVPAPPSTTAMRLLVRPNPLQSRQVLMTSTVRDLLRHGNSLWYLQRDGRGAISTATFVPWNWTVPRVLNVGEGPRLAFDVLNKSAEAELLGLQPRLLPDDVMHCKLASDDGVIGRGPLQRSPTAAREGMELCKAALANWKNGLRPSAILQAPSYLNPTQRERFGDAFIEKLSGSMAAGKVPLIEGGWSLNVVGMKSSDAQFAESRSQNTEAICSLFGVPSVLLQTDQRAVQDLAPYLSALAQTALAPICSVIESEVSHAILDDAPGMELRIDLDGLARGAFASKVSALCALLQSGAVTANDVRQELDWPRIEGGDALRPSNAPNWPADAKGLPSQAPKPGAKGADGLPNGNTNENEGSNSASAAPAQPA